MSILPILFDILTGVCLTIGAWHFLAGIFKKDRYINLTLALLSISVMFYLVFRKMCYMTNDVEEFVIYIKLAMLALPMAGISLSWFIFHYTQDRSFWAVAAITAAYSLIIIVNIFSPESILYREVINLKQAHLPWGEPYTYAEAVMNTWHFLIDFAILIIITYMIYSAHRMYRSGIRDVALFFLILVFIIVFAVVFDYLVLNNYIESIYTLPFFLVIFVVSMSLSIFLGVLSVTKVTEQIREKEEMWENLFDQVNLIVIGLNRMGNVDYINPYFLELTGYEADEVMGMDWFDKFLPKAVTYDVQGAFLEVLKNNFHPYYENPILTKSGKEKMIAWYNVRLIDKDGKISGSLSIGCDISKFCETSEDKSNKEK
jgi:PAS domain S-box-containing protein